ncbi:hypothetical protein QEW_4494 [Clostridioides difficile CD160]|nr:hypothetical protein QEW_4494 [Clostridioides difficile CD160]
MKEKIFRASISLEDFKQTNIFDKKFYDCLPLSKCDCGEELIITKTLSNISCINDFCIYNLGYRLKDLLEDIKVKIDIEDCIEFIKHHKITNIYYIFCCNHNFKLHPNSSSLLDESVIKAISINRELNLINLVSLGHIRSLEGLEEALFSNYNSFDEFYNDLEKNKHNLLYKLLDNNFIESRITKIYRSLLLYKEDFYESLNYIRLIN